MKKISGSSEVKIGRAYLYQKIDDKSVGWLFIPLGIGFNDEFGKVFSCKIYALFGSYVLDDGDEHSFSNFDENISQERWDVYELSDKERKHYEGKLILELL